jgi:DNA polymerase-3 subunit epsilon/CBS domain-containing protein
LAAAWSMLPSVARSLISEEIDPRVLAEIVSEELCSLTRRAALLAEQEMQVEGHGPPPCAYAMLVLGSGGRGESLMAPDQDNAIVFSHGEPDGPEDRWFLHLGTKLADMLDASGVPYCKGGVMAKNAAFRGSLDTWKARVEDWVRRLRPEDLLNVDIVYDLRSVHGDPILANRLIEYAYDRAHSEPVFAKLLGEQITAGNPFTLFGGLQLENGRLDIKKHGLFPIVATARTLAISHGIRERSTHARLEKLIALEIGGDRDMKAMLSGHALLLGLLLRQQTRDLYAGIPVSNRVEIAAISRDQQVELRSLIKCLQSAPDLVRDLMFA